MKFVISLFLMLLLFSHANAQGKYDIGYKTIIDFDHSRTYNLKYPADSSSREHDPRPIIINIWYPAKLSKKDKPMVYGDYIKIQTQDLRLKTFLERIEEYNLKSSAFLMFYREMDSLTSEQKKQFGNQMKLPVEVYRDAAPLNEKFPLVIYHPGLGGTLNDNTVLCEYLASHGFVVMTGAFQGNDYKDVNLNWDLERSTKDLDFMLNRIKDLPFVDFSKISAIGHSFGAQAVLGYRTEDFSPVSCLIIIDTTMDYSFDANPDGFERLTEKLYRKINNMNVPMLVFAHTGAAFKVMDSLKHSDRIYCTIELEHNDFTSLNALSKKNGLLTGRGDPDTVWNKYTLVVDYCLSYLNDRSVLPKSHLANVYEVPKGSTFWAQIPAYADYSRPPTNIQFQKIVYENKIEIVEKVLGLYSKNWSEDDLNNNGYAVLKRSPDVAICLFKKNVELHPGSWNAWDSLAEGYMVKGEKELAITNYRKSIELNPKNGNGIKMLEKLSKN